jgi:hypothetical protein
MTNLEMEKVIGKLVEVTGLLAEEVEELVDARADELGDASTAAIKVRANKIRAAALQLRMAFDQYQ